MLVCYVANFKGVLQKTKMNKQVRELIPNFKKKMDEIDDLIEISPDLDQKILKLISNTVTKCNVSESSERNEKNDEL